MISSAALCRCASSSFCTLLKRLYSCSTHPAPGAETLGETHKVFFNYPELPIPGTHFDIKTQWDYTRHTDFGDLHYSVNETKQNPHVLLDKLLLTDKKRYLPGEKIKLFAFILPEKCAPKKDDSQKHKAFSQTELDKLLHRPDIAAAPLSVTLSEARSTEIDTKAAISVTKCPCECYHLSAILTPVTVDKAYPIVLKEPVVKNWQDKALEILETVRKSGDKALLERVYLFIRYGCFYTGELTIGNIPYGGWKHYLFVQTVNCTPEGMDPLLAAQTIGGLPVSQNTKPNLGVACGPLVYEDGQFDIEVI